MAFVTQTFKLDITPGASRPVIHASQGDIGRPFKSELYWNGEAWTPGTGVTCKIRGKKPDATVFEYDETSSTADVEIDGAAVLFDTSEQMTIIPGPVECELVFNDGVNDIASANFVLIVEDSPYDPNAISESEVQGLNAMIQAATPEAVDDWFETEAPTSTVFANAVNDATDAYLDENGVTVNYDNIVGAPDADEIQKYMDGFDDIADWVEETNTTVVDASPWTSGYMTAAGDIYQNTSYVYSQHVDVEEGDIVGAFWYDDLQVRPLRFITAFNGDTVVTSAGTNTEANSYTVPAGVTSLVITCYAVYYTDLRISIRRNVEQTKVRGLQELDNRVTVLEGVSGVGKNKYMSKTAATMTSGDTLYLENAKNALKKSQRIVFECDGIPDTLYIGMAWNTTTPGLNNLETCVKITDTVIGYRHATNGTFAESAHNITLNSNIQVILEWKAPTLIDITLISDGELITMTFGSQSIGCDYPVALIDGGTVTNAKLTWTSADFDKKVWLFGDSYLSMGDASRLPYYLNESGYLDNVLIDAYSGQNSQWAIQGCRTLLSCGTPKFALWALGMNDGGDSSTAPSTNWVTYRDQFITLCEDNGVTPILATIPTVPTVNNEKKNEWVRNSGYRYVDYAKAVGASSSGTWYPGMLSSDNVHPSAKGGKALFARLLLDLPEIMISD